MHGITKWQLVLRRLEQELHWLGRRALEYLYPTRCVGCEQMGVLLCRQFAGELNYIDQSEACPRCGAPFGIQACTECLPVYADKLGGSSEFWGGGEQGNNQTHLGLTRVANPRSFLFTQACSALEFDNLSRKLVLAYKDGGERRLAPKIASMLAGAISKDWRRWVDIITWIPADSQAIRRRGFDHMALIAGHVQDILGIKTLSLFKKQALMDQRKLNRIERQENMAMVFSIEAPNAVLDKNVIVIDDVFTTGATLSAAAKELALAHAKEIRVATLCRVW